MLKKCLLKHNIEGKIKGGTEVMGWQGAICKQLLDGLKATRKYCKLIEKALDSTL
jgi:hypothetical protein